MTHTDIAATATPEWLLAMRAMDGLKEEPGPDDNPKILAMRDTIALKFPGTAAYCALYLHDETPWCGLAVGYCMALAGIMPPFGKDDEHRFFWAKSWADSTWGTLLSTPRLGCVVVLSRDGGGHVTLYESTVGGNYRCRGGNQSDGVNVSEFPISSVIALVWPKEAGEIPTGARPELEQGDSGPDVEHLQSVLGLPEDGEFGSVTRTQVTAFQLAVGLDADGVVGEKTWIAINGLEKRVKDGHSGIDGELTIQIGELAAGSDANHIEWENRGLAPEGYVPGMAMVYALTMARLLAGDDDAVEMAKAVTTSQYDALNVYADEFRSAGMDNSRAGTDTLRHLFVMLVGLGMRESSGKYCEGRDMSATNTSAMTTEAGMFQTSWNINTAHPCIVQLFNEYMDDPNGFRETFAIDIEPTTRNLSTYGTGQGATFQFLSKYSPAFAALVAGVGLRNRSNHWGPINRHEVEIRKEVDDLFKEVEDLIRNEHVPPVEPGPTVNITSTGDVKITVNGKPV